MRLVVAAIGRLRGGPEVDLAADYLRRATDAGRRLGFGPAELVELEAKTGGVRREAELLRDAAPAGAVRIALDERGAALRSAAFAETLARWRDAGRPAATFWIGGADGLAPGLAEEADLVLAFGPQTWPHRLVRVMLAEQVYRAITILANLPYHRA